MDREVPVLQAESTAVDRCKEKKVVLAISEVQRYVGWAIQAGSYKGQCLETSSEIVSVLEQMRIFHREAMLDDDYIKDYYLDSEQIYNQRGLTLVARTMFPWALYLMEQIREHYSRSSLQKYGSESIKRAIALVKRDKSVQHRFMVAFNSYQDTQTSMSQLILY